MSWLLIDKGCKTYNAIEESTRIFIWQKKNNNYCSAVKVKWFLMTFRKCYHCVWHEKYSYFLLHNDIYGSIYAYVFQLICAAIWGKKIKTCKKFCKYKMCRMSVSFFKIKKNGAKHYKELIFAIKACISWRKNSFDNKNPYR